MSESRPTATRLHGVEEYYFSRKLTEVAQRRAAGEHILNLGIGNPDLPPPPGVVEALERASQQAGANGYQSYRGIAEWRTALKEWYARDYGVELEEQGLLPLAGSKEGIVHLALALRGARSCADAPRPRLPPPTPRPRSLAGGAALPYPLPASNDESGEAWIARLTTVMQGADVCAALRQLAPHADGPVAER